MQSAHEEIRKVPGVAGTLEEILGRRPGVEVRFEDASAALLDEAIDEPSTLIAVGSRGLGAVSRIRLGSVSIKVFRATEGSVLVYPHYRSWS